MCRGKSLISSEAGELLSSLRLSNDGISVAEEGRCDRLCGDFVSGDAADHVKIDGAASSIKYRRALRAFPCGRTQHFRCMRSECMIQSVFEFRFMRLVPHSRLNGQ